MTTIHTQQQLDCVIMEFRRRDAYIQSLVPTPKPQDYDCVAWYHVADIRVLYPGCTLRYVKAVRHHPDLGLDYSLQFIVAGEVVATHKAAVVTCSQGRPYAVAVSRPNFVDAIAPEVVAPEPSVELAAALAGDQ
jgi:hypothetical protein